MGLLPQRPERCVSTNFTTSANFSLEKFAEIAMCSKRVLLNMAIRQFFCV